MRGISSAVCGASLLIFAGGSTSAQYANNEQVVTFAAEVPLLDCDGTPCVEAKTSDGRTWRLGIDTGNADSVLDTKVAEAAGLKPTRPTPQGWPAGMFITTAPTVQIGGVTFRDVHLVAMNLADYIAKGTMPRVDGTLAYTVFKNRYLQLDFAVHELRISEVLTAPMDCGKTCDKFSLITFGKNGPRLWWRTVSRSMVSV